MLVLTENGPEKAHMQSVTSNIIGGHRRHFILVPKMKCSQ